MSEVNSFEETKPAQFSSGVKTVIVAVGISIIVLIPVTWAIVRMFLDVRRRRRAQMDQEHKKDLESGEDSDVETHQSSKVETSQVGKDMVHDTSKSWEEGCKKEVDGRMEEVKTEGDSPKTPKSVLKSWRL